MGRRLVGSIILEPTSPRKVAPASGWTGQLEGL